MRRLIERVRKIDPEAAEYLEGVFINERGGVPCSKLSRAMTWKDTPQHYDYWSKINQRLLDEDNKHS